MYKIERFGETDWIMPKDSEIAEEYKDDPLAHYSEFSVGSVSEGIARSFWGIATCKISEEADKIAIVLLLKEAEELSGV